MHSEAESANNAPHQLADALRIANEHYRAGRLAEADTVCQQILLESPNNPDALYLLGMIAYQVGMHDVAEIFFSNLVEALPASADAYNNLGVTLLAQGKTEDAAACYRQAIALQPGHSNAHYNLGNVLKDMNDLTGAIASYRRAIAIQPNYVNAHNNLADALQRQGKLTEAIACYRQALVANPNLAEVHYNLGDALKEQGKQDEALACYQRAIQIRPNYAEAYNNQGTVLSDQGKQDAALECYRQAIKIRPNYAEAYYNQGAALEGLVKQLEAIESYRQAIHFKPDFAEAYSNLGQALVELNMSDEAIKYGQQALLLKPDSVGALNLLGTAFRAQGKLDDAILCDRQLFPIAPDPAAVYSNLLFTMQYTASVTPEEKFKEHQRYAEIFETPHKGQWTAHQNDRNPERRLKIGYVSGDFRCHSVANFIEPILSSHDKSLVEIYCYSNHIKHDTHTDRIAACADHWLLCTKIGDERLADHIRADGIDILVDLSGHTGENRLPVFARKPAPVQVTWIGYPGTTGLTAMDYRITDDRMDPPGLTERFHSETLIRLSDMAAAFQPEANSPPVNTLPALNSDSLVFASLNNVIKINASVAGLWSKILQALPLARLMLGNVTDGETRQRLIELFGREGISQERLILQPRMPLINYLELHQQIDVALDPFPYNGGTSTMHSLWMGVPVITLAGNGTASRVGVSALSRLGLDQFITNSEEEYLQRAIQIAQDLPALNLIRQSLRARMSSNSSAPESITRNLEKIYRDIWRTWCAEQATK